MSRKPPKNSDEDHVDSDDEHADSDNQAASSDDVDSPDSLNDTGESPIIAESDVSEESEPDEPDDEEFDDEFSLDQLSRAYEEVLKTRTGANHDTSIEADLDLDDPSEPDESEGDSSSESESSNDNAGCPISPESIIESILFVGAPKDVKLNSRKVAAVLRDVSPKEVTTIVRELNAKYEKENTAYRIESDGGVFKMILDPKLLDFQQHYFGRNRQVRLTQSAIDVMAIVAYNQPVTREQVDKIRGRPSGSVLTQLFRRQLVFIEPGESNPKIKYYSTTDRFLDLFQLEEIADLPQSHDVSDMDELAD